MRDYGQVHASFWSSDTTASLPDGAKLLALYLLTSPHTNAAGVFRLPLAYASEDTGWDAERLRNGFETLSNADFIQRDDRTGWTWICKFHIWNKPANPNIRKAVRKFIDAVPGVVHFKDQILESWGFSETVTKPLDNTPSPSPSPSLEEQCPEVSESVLRDFKALRKTKKAPITPTAISGIQREAGKAGMTLEAALAMCCERGWTGFKAEWVNNGKPPEKPRKRKEL